MKPTHTFRSGKSQARALAAEMARHGESRHVAKAGGDHAGVQGLGTERITKQVLAQYAEWLHREHLGDLRTSGRDTARHYLEQRAELVGQSTLNQERQALDRLQRHLYGSDAEPLPRIRSELETVKSGRAYSSAQLEAIRAAQTPRNAITSLLAEKCGLRAHEAFTVRPAAEQPASGHRTWSADRFTCANGRPDGELYTVRGKGGLVREIWIERELVNRLEAYRLPTPERVTDRGIHYDRQYGIGGGQVWSQSFSAASRRVLGWSNGGHGCRHTYVQRRLEELQESGMKYREARLIVSQECGHFRESVIDEYLR